MHEYGLSQINDFGIDVLLRWNVEYYRAVCQGVLSNCNKAYVRHSPSNRALLRGVVLSTIDADCSSCPYMINLNKAQESIQNIALVVQANCVDTRYLLLKNTYPPDYEDFWKYTMVSYHSGIGCLERAIQETTARQEPNDWDHLSNYLPCEGAKEYVDDLWDLLEETAGTVEAPEDWSIEHDHYLYGTHKHTEK